MQSPYDLVADVVDRESWEQFESRLLYGFKGFPESWTLSADIQAKLILRLQYENFNPDLVEGIAEKRARSWAFMRSFLSPEFQRKFSFLRSRHSDSLERWDREFASFEGLLYLSSMDPSLQLEWLARFDSKLRYGHRGGRVKVIKKKGLGLSCALLGVDVLMTWEEIKARYRFMMKKHHPDVGGDPAFAQELNQAFKALGQVAAQKMR